jgi:hypothetical protein
MCLWENRATKKKYILSLKLELVKYAIIIFSARVTVQ